MQRRPLTRREEIADAPGVGAVIAAAFAHAEHSNHREHELVSALRSKGAIVVSIVAEVDGKLVGHIAFSKVTIDGIFDGWFGLAPLSVAPEYQGRGVGTALMHTGLDALRALKAHGCVLLGEPRYYGRFGFAPRDGLTLPGVPPEYFLALPFADHVPTGRVAYDPTFAIFG